MWMLTLRERGERVGPTLPLATSNSDWLLQGKCPIRELPITSSLLPLTEEGAGEQSQVTPHSKYSEFPAWACLVVCVCYVCDRVCVCGYLWHLWFRMGC